jgi:hypothetical protein
MIVFTSAEIFSKNKMNKFGANKTDGGKTSGALTYCTKIWGECISFSSYMTSLAI